VNAPAVPRVLVVESEPAIATLIASQLTREGYRVETAATGQEALRAVGKDIPDLVVLDRLLPDMRGEEVLQNLRGEPETEGIPVLMLTALREQEERIEGLKLGADDYLTTPFSPHELVMSVQAILRRSGEAGGTSGGRILEAGPISVDVDAHQASLHGEDLNLTPTEFRLLRALVERRDRTQSRQQLLEKAWDVESGVAARTQTRTVDMHVRRLRSKLGEGGGWIQTIRGFGPESPRFGLPD